MLIKEVDIMRLMPIDDNDCSFERERKLFKMLLDAIPSSVLFIDRDMRIIMTNRNFLEKSRRSLANTIDHRLEDVFPDVILKHTDMEKQIQQVFYRKTSCRDQQMTYRAPGVPITFYYYSIFPCVWQGMVENVMLLMEDVTERIRLSEEVRRIERHLASVVESATDMVLSTDINGRILTWNTAAEKLSGYTQQEMKGCHFSNLFRSSHHKELFNTVFSKIERENKSQTIECDLITQQETQIPVSWVLSPMKDDYLQTIAIVVIGRDLTERRKFEEQLLQSQKLAALGVMAGGIAHEIRNPLAVCSSAAQFIMDDEIPGDFRKECADKIQTGIYKASLIIENLLKFSRSSTHTDMTLLDLVSVIKETLALITNQAKLQKIEIGTDFFEESILIRGVSNLLQQVFMNIFLNAIKSMPQGGALKVTTKRTEEYVLVYIKDTGCGMSKNKRSQIFDPFYTTAPVGKGIGLGLSLCYSIIKQHSGNIEVESFEGKGSIFTVRLPVLAAISGPKL